jgi:hypothetical protein
MKNIIKYLLIVSSLTISLLALDKPSALTVQDPSNGKSLYGDETISFSWSSVDGASKYYYICDTNSSASPKDSSDKKETSGTDGTCSISSSGTYYVIVQAFDGSSEYSLEKVSSSLSVDVDDPVVTITKTTNDDGTVSVTMSSSDASSTPRKIYFTTDGSTPSSSSSTEYSSELKFAVTATINAIAIDNAANKGTASTSTGTLSLEPTVKTTQDTKTAHGATFATSNTNLVS